jgi:hypothetical protein
MAREINKELMRQIYSFIEQQFYFNNKRPVKKSLQDISDFLKSNYGKEIANPMILYYVRKLSDEGRIKYSREDIGNNANEYEILELGNDWLKSENEKRGEKENIEKIEDNEEKQEGDEEMMMNTQLQLNNISLESAVNQIKQTLNLIEELKRNNIRYEYLKKALEGLKPIGTTIDGNQLFQSSSNWNLLEIVQLINKNENRDHF